jgi:UDP-3-O-[3-hydroxymyristoyl] N-acetylglucosamine deacetylase
LKIKRKTLKEEIFFSGISLHKGIKSTLKLIPYDKNEIKIIRSDLKSGFTLKDKNILPGSLSSNIGIKNCEIGTVEHLFATLHAFQITDLIIEIDSPEIPILDGSALLFAEKIKSTGLKELEGTISPIEVKNKVEILEDGKYISIEPFSDKLDISYEINFNHPVINKQSFNITVTPESFLKELAGARTFGFLSDFEKLKKMNLALGANLDNVIGLDEKTILNKSKLRFPNEFARHKTLDLLGDLYLKGLVVHGKVIAKFAGHRLHQKLLEKIS